MTQREIPLTLSQYNALPTQAEIAAAAALICQHCDNALDDGTDPGPIVEDRGTGERVHVRCLMERASTLLEWLKEGGEQCTDDEGQQRMYGTLQQAIDEALTAKREGKW